MEASHKMVKFWLITCLLTLLQQCLVNGQDQNSLIRISLRRTTKAQGGDLGQPVTSYYANINVGTPPKNFRFLVDINARETWIPHYLKLGFFFQRLNYRDGYMKKSSSTSKKEEQEYTINFDEQLELVGKNYEDLFEFSNVREHPLPVKYKQRFLAISSANSDLFNKFNTDGVLALNPYPMSETGSDPPLVALQRANLTSDLKFGLLLEGQAAATDDQSSSGGELAFGKVESSGNYVGALKYHLVVGQQFWELNLQIVMLGSYTISCFANSCGAVLSTNQNDIFGPAQDVAKVIKMLGLIKEEKDFNQRQLYEIDCLKVASSPNLTFVIDGALYELHPLSYIRKKTDGILFKSSTCYVAIRALSSKNKWHLGTNVLSNYYTIFDMSKRQVAFGKRK